MTKKTFLIAFLILDEIRNMCYGNMSTHIFPDVSLCEKITDEMKQNMCYAEVAINLVQ